MADRPGVRSNARRRGRPFPISKSITPAAAGVNSPSQNRSRPPLRASIPHLHLWRGGGRQAGGEVRQAGGEVKHQSMRSDVITPLKKYVYF